jgi:hypothetical protein
MIPLHELKRQTEELGELTASVQTQIRQLRGDDVSPGDRKPAADVTRGFVSRKSWTRLQSSFLATKAWLNKLSRRLSRGDERGWRFW